MIPLLLVLITFLFIPYDLFAWGLETHLKIGSTILENVSFALIKQYPTYFLLGNIFPDFFTLLKNLSKIKRGLDTHSWITLGKLFKNACSDEEKSFCHGYAAHLAADIVAHNFYIPQTFFLVSKNKLISHLILEYAETRNSLEYEGLLESLLDMAKDGSQLFLRTKGLSKDYFVRQISYLKLSIKSQNLIKLKVWAFLFEKTLDPYFVNRSNYYQEKAITLAQDAVINGFIGFEDFDPKGTESMFKAKELRKRLRDNFGRFVTKKLARKRVIIKNFALEEIN
jgi:hypothetical protein